MNLMSKVLSYIGSVTHGILAPTTIGQQTQK
jgi:hypothetical protein